VDNKKQKAEEPKHAYFPLTSHILEMTDMKSQALYYIVLYNII